jgi:hypothetical protein
VNEHDVDALDRALDLAADGGHAHLVPSRIVELVTLATEVAEAVTAPSLSAADRARLLARIERLAPSRGARPSRPLGVLVELRRHPVVAGAGGAVLTLAAAVAVSLLRERGERKSDGTAAQAA